MSQLSHIDTRSDALAAGLSTEQALGVVLIMRRLFARSSPSNSTPTSVSAGPAEILDSQLQGFVPPHDHIAILVTSDGLLLRPHRAGTASYVKIGWTRTGAQENGVTLSTGEGDFDWTDSVVVYGIVGILDLYSGGSKALFFDHMLLH